MLKRRGSGKPCHRIYLFAAVMGLLLLFGFYLFSSSQSNEYASSPDQWKSEYMDTGSWNVSSLTWSGDEPSLTILEVPVGPLHTGTYVLTIQYLTDTQQVCEIRSANNSVFLNANPFQLSTGRRSVTYHFSVTRECDDISIFLKYTGGNFQLNDLSVQNSPVGLRILIVIYLVLCGVFSIFLFHQKLLRRHRTVLMALAGITLLASLPLLMPGNGYGDDYGFHLLRIEGIAQALADGVFPLRINPSFNDGYGYPVSVFYGDALLYFPALLRLIGFSVDFSYKSYIILVNALTSTLMYWVCRRILVNQASALLCSLLYTTASYRLVDIYSRSAVGEYTALVFLPLIGLAIYNIYTQDIQDWKQYRKNAGLLAFGISGLLFTHILSVEMTVFSLFVIALVSWRKTFRKRTLVVYFTAAGLAALLCAGFLIPFLDYYLKVDTLIKAFTEAKFLIQMQGTYLTDYFSFFRDYYGAASTQSSQRMQFTPGLPLMAAGLMGLWLWLRGKSDRIIRGLLFLSAAYLFIASNLFPWNHLAASSSIGNLLAQVQFPWRYIGFSLFPLALLAGYLMEHAHLLYISRKSLCIFAATTGVLMSFHFLSNYADVKYTTLFLDFPELPVYTYAVDGKNISAVAAAEYMLQGTSVDHLSGEIVATNTVLNSFSSEGISMTAEVSNSTTDAFIEFPRFNYPYYCVRDTYGQVFPIQDGQNRLIHVDLPEGYSGQLTLSFEEPLLWRIAELVSLATLITLSLCAITRYKRKKCLPSQKSNTLSN